MPIDRILHDLPDVKGFSDVMKQLPRRPPFNFKRFETLGDPYWEYWCRAIVRRMKPDESDKNLEAYVQYLVSSECQSMLCSHVRIKRMVNSISQTLEDAGRLSEAPRYLECYLAMLYHHGHSEGECMTALNTLLKIALDVCDGKMTLELPSDFPAYSATEPPSSPTSQNLSSPRITPRSLEPRSQKRKAKTLTFAERTARAFVRFVYTALPFERVLGCDDQCKVWNPLLHYFSERMRKTAHPKTTVSRYTNADRQRNEVVIGLLAASSPSVVIDTIRGWPEVQQSLATLDLIIENITALCKRNVDFIHEFGKESWEVRNPSGRVESFEDPQGFFDWLLSERVKDFMGSSIEIEEPKVGESVMLQHDDGIDHISGKKRARGVELVDGSNSEDGRKLCEGKAPAKRKRRRTKRQKDKKPRSENHLADAGKSEEAWESRQGEKILLNPGNRGRKEKKGKKKVLNN